MNRTIDWREKKKRTDSKRGNNKISNKPNYILLLQDPPIFHSIFRSNFLAAHLDSYQRVNSLMHSNEILLIPTIKQTKTIFTGYK